MLVKGWSEHATRILYAIDGSEENGFVGGLQALLEQCDILFDDLGNQRVVVNDFIGVEEEKTGGAGSLGERTGISQTVVGLRNCAALLTQIALGPGMLQGLQ